ncbi:hypothetical protein V5O48_018289 [Marasmius crinis-equi]|uniref:Calpain catalytic domain-containing protein n=1 Tax=Marasmius crinis-equi TaxID=585013 RepID=A0ABR3ELN3_9AGAR
MPFLKKFRSRKAERISARYRLQEPIFFNQRTEKAGLLVTVELEKALADCKAKVERIARECRANNRRFRDTEFDFDEDKDRCLHGIENEEERDENYTPSDVQRVTRIFDKPEFFIDGADSNDIHQGAIGDCWFVSALATVATCEGLIETACVARDQEVGVYGFIFFRDSTWVTVIIDDFVFTSIPKFEELGGLEKQLYHFDKEKYNQSARKDGKSLYFARSGTQGETWVPLLEKAYAKLHGSYFALSGGSASDAIEDLTGGVSTLVSTKDILNIDKFWHEELCRANKDRLFGCFINGLDSTRSGESELKVNGLFPSHAYSVLRAVEHKGKRFVVVRNPWGNSEWTGRWSDGSKEWTQEWLEALPALGHTFGDDGQFLMEYSDFLECWEYIDRTFLFDSSWIMSSQWLQVAARPLPSVYTYGDVSFTFSLPEASSAFIMLSQLNNRYFKPIAGIYIWTADFIVYKKGETDYVARSAPGFTGARSVNCEVYLQAGDYVVHVRLDRHQCREKACLCVVFGYYAKKTEEWSDRTLSRLLSERAKGRSIASNFEAEAEGKNVEIPLEALAGQDLAELEVKAQALALAKQEEKEEKKEEKDENGEEKEKDGGEEEKKKDDDDDKKDKDKVRKREEVITTTRHADGSTTTTSTVIEKITTILTKKTRDGEVSEERTEETVLEVDGDNVEGDSDDDDDDGEEESKEKGWENAETDPETEKENNSVFLGLKIYTKKNAPVVINGQLRQEGKITAALAL